MLELWEELQEKHRRIYKDISSDNTLMELFRSDSNRAKRFSREAVGLFFDFSKNHIDPKTFEVWQKFLEKIDLKNHIRKFFQGSKINQSEDRRVLHMVLRAIGQKTPCPEDEVIKAETELKRLESFAEKIRSGEWQGYDGQRITDVVNIGIGGSDLGPRMACQALEPYGHDTLKFHFVSNIDGTVLAQILATLRPGSTLFIIASKTFTTQESLTNAETARSWLLDHFKQEYQAITRHFVAISTNLTLVKNFGIHPNNMFQFWDWVGGRYSIWSAIGLSILIKIGSANFREFLLGAYEMDQHFYETDFSDNLPVLLAIIATIYRNFLGSPTHAILPYDNLLSLLPSYLQQLEMESNGKRVSKTGDEIQCLTAPIIWGGVGTDSQHSFYQLLHQGKHLVPIDFIISSQPAYGNWKHHEILVANCIAQSQALLEGRSLLTVREELESKGLSEEQIQILAPQMVMLGNSPSTTIVIENLSPRTLGTILALYEHKVFVQGIIWNINSFDQWGVELGKILCKKILNRKEDFLADQSTLNLIDRLLNPKT